MKNFYSFLFLLSAVFISSCSQNEMLNGSTNDNPSTEKNVLSDAVIMTKDGQEPDERQAIGRVKK